MTEHWYRRQLRELYGSELLQKMDEATMRMQNEGPSCGPTGDCPKCDGPLVYLCEKDVHYCAMCDVKYSDSKGSPVATEGVTND